MRIENKKNGSSPSSGAKPKDSGSSETSETSEILETSEALSKKTKLLIVDDDEAILTQMKWGLSNDYEVSLAEDGVCALSVFKKERPPLVVLDLGLPPRPRTEIEGLRLLKAFLDEAPMTKVIIVSGNMERSNEINAVSQGAYDFFSKPIDLNAFQTILKKAHYLYEVENEQLQLKVV